MKKIFLTGATSFLGKRIQHIFSPDVYDITATANHESKEKTIQKVDLTSRAAMKSVFTQYTPDVVIHAGASVDLSRDFEVGKKCLEVNTIGTMHLLEAIKETHPYVIYISSEEVYGNGPLPFHEDQRIDPPSPYALSKAAAEHMCLWYGKEYGFPVVVLRLGTFYGPEQPKHKYFAQTILHALNNEPIPCNSGIKKRDYIYVDDAVELIRLIVEKQYEENYIVNGTGGIAYQLLDVIKRIKNLTQARSEVQIGAIPDRITERNEWLADITRAKELYEWEPTTTLDDGLRNMVEYYKKMTNEKQ